MKNNRPPLSPHAIWKSWLYIIMDIFLLLIVWFVSSYSIYLSPSSNIHTRETDLWAKHQADLSPWWGSFKSYFTGVLLFEGLTQSQDFTFKSSLQAASQAASPNFNDLTVRLTRVLVSSLQLRSKPLKWRIINSDGWLSARSDWTILRADQFPASLYRCWWWVTQLIRTRESMPWILFSPLAHWHEDAATLLHTHCIHTHCIHTHPHTQWGTHWLTDYMMLQPAALQHKLFCLRAPYRLHM